MVHDKDRAFKSLTARYAEDYAAFVLGTSAGAEPFQLETQDRQLTALSRDVDFVARVQLEGQQVLLLLEFQTRWETDMPLRMAEYVLRLHRRYALPVVAAVAVLRRGGSMRNHWQIGVGERPTLSCHFQIIRLWRHSAQTVVAQRLVGLYPLLPVMAWGVTPPEAALEQCDQLILEQVQPGEAQVDAWIALRVFARTVFSAELVDRVLPRRPQMIESPGYEDLLEEGRVQGRLQGRLQGELQGELRGRLQGELQGRLQGEVQGKLQGQRDAVIAALEARFGPVPAAVAAQVGQLADLPLLSAQHRRAVVVESLEVFAQELAAVQLAPA